jgi:lipoate-protein ligase A
MPTGTPAYFFLAYRTDPYFNMGFDEWLLEKALVSPQFIAIRLYSWQIGTITIGLNQRADTAVNWLNVGKTPVIRRITGGRALFHDESELTYTIVCGDVEADQSPFSGSLDKTTRDISGSLISFLENLGLNAEYARQSSSIDAKPVQQNKAPCFASVSRYEVVSSGKKIIASAQRRIGKAFLQHGSIKILGIDNHPALWGQDGQVQKNIQPITQEQFNKISLDFGNTIKENFHLESVEYHLSNRENHEINLISEELKANPLENRKLPKIST